MGIQARGVNKVIGSTSNKILSDISLDIQDGEFISLTGRSGAGKSTLLYLLSTLDTASSGTIQIDGQSVSAMDAHTLNRFRNEKMGFVFQFHYLIAELTSLENTLLPARKHGLEDHRKAYALELLDRFGLKGKENRLPRQLSGGEMQRVAIARSLVMGPRYLFADEPTGSLDSVSGELVIQILREANEKLGTTLILVTHEPDYARLAKRQIQLRDGRIV